jgi:hypothetical protein
MAHGHISLSLRPLLILGFRAGALRHPAGDFLSDKCIYHQNNQPTFLNRENIFDFVLGLLSFRKVINVGFQGVKSILS